MPQLLNEQQKRDLGLRVIAQFEDCTVSFSKHSGEIRSLKIHGEKGFPEKMPEEERRRHGETLMGSFEFCDVAWEKSKGQLNKVKVSGEIRFPSRTEVRRGMDRSGYQGNGQRTPTPQYTVTPVAATVAGGK